MTDSILKTHKNALELAYMDMRRAIGFMAFALPLLLMVGHVVPWLGIETLQSSISSYYYTSLGSAFTGVMFCFGVFLFTYPGYVNSVQFIGISFTDNAVTNAAGIFAMGVVFIPTDPCPEIPRWFVGLDAIHLTAATFFFICLAILSGVMFSHYPSNVAIPEDKKRENRKHKWCARVIVGGIAVLGGRFILHKTGLIVASDVCHYTSIVFIIETIMMFAFGYSWILKGEAYKHFSKKFKSGY